MYYLYVVHVTGCTDEKLPDTLDLVLYSQLEYKYKMNQLECYSRASPCVKNKLYNVLRNCESFDINSFNTCIETLDEAKRLKYNYELYIKNNGGPPDKNIDISEYGFDDVVTII